MLNDLVYQSHGEYQLTKTIKRGLAHDSTYIQYSCLPAQPPSGFQRQDDSTQLICRQLIEGSGLLVSSAAYSSKVTAAGAGHLFVQQLHPLPHGERIQLQ
jgi:hypothetical protein